MSNLHVIDWSEVVTQRCIIVVLQVTLVAAAGLLASRLFRRDASTRHAVLLLTLIVLAVSPITLFGLQGRHWSLLVISPPKPVNQFPGPASAEIRPLSPTPMSRDTLNVLPAAKVPADVAIVGSEQPRPDAHAAWPPSVQVDSKISSYVTKWRFGFWRFAALVWAAGSVLILLRIVHGMHQVQRLCRAAIPAKELKVAHAIAAVESCGEMRNSWRLLISDRIRTAFATGLIRPTIVLPREYVDSLSTNELALVLTHEAAHLVRRDFLVAVMQRLAVLVYWPHPLLHALNRRLARAREEACDNFVLQQHPPAEYARLLLRLKELSPAGIGIAGVLAFLDPRWSLEERVSGMLDAHRERATSAKRRALVPVATVLLAVGVFLAGIRVSDHAPAALNAAPAMPVPAGAAVRLGDNRLHHSGWHKNVGFSADGQIFVSSSESSLRFWDVKTGELQREVSLGGLNVSQMRMTPDRLHVALLGRESGSDGRYNAYEIRFLDLEGNVSETSLKWVQEEFGEEKMFVFTPDGRIVLVGDSSGFLTIREVVSGVTLLRYRIAERGITGLAISPDGHLVAIATESNTLFLWDWQSDAEPTALNSDQRWLGVAFSPNGQQLAAGMDSSPEVELYDVATRKKIRSLKDDPEAPILAEEVAFTPDGKQLAVANAVALTDRFVGAVLVWDVESGKLERRLSAPGVHPRALAISPDGRSIGAADWDTSLKIWNLETGTPLIAGAGGHEGLIREVVYPPSSRQILTAAEDHSARLWDAASGAEVATLPQAHGTQTAALSLDGTMAVTGGMDDTVIVWNLPAATKRYDWHGGRTLGGAWELNFTLDSGEVVALMDDLRICRWSTRTGKPVKTLRLEPRGLQITSQRGGRSATAPAALTNEFDREDFMHAIDARTFAPDAEHVVLAGRAQEPSYWVFDTATGTQQSQRVLPFRAAAVRVSPDGQRIAFGGHGKLKRSEKNSPTYNTEDAAGLTVVNFETGDTLWSSTVAATVCGPVQFSADGQWLAAVLSSSTDGPSVRLYEATTGKEVHSIDDTSPVRTPNSMVFSPDGKSFAVGQSDSTVLIWNLETFGPPFAH